MREQNEKVGMGMVMVKQRGEQKITGYSMTGGRRGDGKKKGGDNG